MDTENQNPLVQRIAVYRSLEHNWVHVSRYYGDEDAAYHKGDVRISEVQELTFSPLHNDSVVLNALKSLDAMEHQARMDLGEKLGRIEQQREQLRAITYEATNP